MPAVYSAKYVENPDGHSITFRRNLQGRLEALLNCQDSRTRADGLEIAKLLVG
jgi:hypothetical protein